MQTAYPNILDKNGKLIKFATVRGPWPRVIETLEGTLDDLLAGGYQTVSVTVMILRLSASRYPRNAALIELLILDVDGVLTDGRLTTASGGESAKSFYVQDGCAIKLWQRCGGKVAILSGRSSEAVTRRATELAIEWVHLAVTDKLMLMTILWPRPGAMMLPSPISETTSPTWAPCRAVAFRWRLPMPYRR